jgi:hypothetical protein
MIAAAKKRAKEYHERKAHLITVGSCNDALDTPENIELTGDS